MENRGEWIFGRLCLLRLLPGRDAVLTQQEGNALWRAIVSLGDLRLADSLGDIQMAEGFPVEQRLHAFPGADVPESLFTWHDFLVELVSEAQDLLIVLCRPHMVLIHGDVC